MKKPYLFFGLIILSAIFFISSCANPPKVSENGFLEGKIIIGPICPVERLPPDPKCQATEETYKAWPIAVWKNDRTKVARIVTKADGTYRIELSKGSYIVDLEKQHDFAERDFGGKGLPATITINSSETTKLDIDIDTGIR